MTWTVLVVEDNLDFQMLIRLVLTQAGYEVVVADNGQAGLDYIDAHGVPDLILSDVHMPFVSGLEFVRRLRSRPATAAARVIFTSCDTATFHDATNLGAVGFIPKGSMSPVRALLDEVGRILTH